MQNNGTLLHEVTLKILQFQQTCLFKQTVLVWRICPGPTFRFMEWRHRVVGRFHGYECWTLTFALCSVFHFESDFVTIVGNVFNLWGNFAAFELEFPVALADAI